MPRKEKAPAFQVYAADELADAATMTREQFGTWNVLRAIAWRDVGLPTDPAQLAAMMGVKPKDFARAWAVVGAGFVEIGGRYVLPWQEDQRAKHAALRDRNAVNGQHGGRPPKLDPTPPEGTQAEPTGFPEPNPDESSSNFSLLGSEKQSSFVETREGSDATVRPASPPSGAVTGVVVGDIAGAAVVLTAAVNRGITATHGEQPHPLRHNAQHAHTEKLLKAGVDVLWARDWLYHRAKDNTHAADLPGSLAYFVAWCTKAWRQHVAEAASKADADAFVPGVDPAPRAEPGTAVTGFTPAPSAAERLAARSRENTRIALAAHAAHRGRSA